LCPDDAHFDSDATSQPNPDETGKTKWHLTKSALDGLLSAFSDDQAEAGLLYQRMYVKLIRYFEWRGIASPEERADQAMNRVARKLEEGQEITNLKGYIYGVARHVFEEAFREQMKAPDSLDDVPAKDWEKVVAPDVESDPRLPCLDRCVDGLNVESRFLILEYYQDEQREKIKRRQHLADTLQIPMNALRIRVHRIRMSLEDCIQKCLGSQTV
jgi:DNA-directed RNA polymerase specialized sigma24 family protein